MIYLSVALAIFILISVVLFWYNRQVVQNLFYILDTCKEYNSIIQEFKSHLDEVYKKDTFYGDATLEGLLEHTKDMSSATEQISDRIKNVLDWE